MKHSLAALFLALALAGAGAPVLAQEDTEASAPASDEGKSLVIINASDDDDVGPVGRALGTGLAAILEEHVLTRDDLSEKDREEVREAIAELRGEIKDEARDVKREVHEEVRKEVEAAVNDVVDAATDGKKQHRVVINNPLARTSSDDGDGDFGIFQAIVASLAIVFTLGMPIIIVSLIMYSSYRKRRLAHDTINQFLASGKEIPPEIMQNMFKEAGTAPQAPRTMLHKGTVNTGIGLGMVIGFGLMDAEFLAAIGCIFLLAGLAQLLIWKLEQGKKIEGDTAQGQ